MYKKEVKLRNKHICQIFKILINLKCEEPEIRTEVSLDCQLYLKGKSI